MSDFITLTCPNCGGRLEITNDVDRFACAYCGAEHLVRRGGGIVTLAPVLDGLRDVQVGVNRAASELAIHRLETEINRLADHYRVVASQLAALPKRPARRSLWRAAIRAVFAGALVALGVFVVGALLFGGRGAALAFGLTPVAAIFVIVGRVWLHWRVLQRDTQQLIASRAQMESTLMTLTREIQDRQRQLAHHRRVVSG